ncbi:MAG: hypothetical protein EDM05_64505 [Leptolyngbya sp. IPPAS B-1204]|uniref:Uncharacterized protein n=1 Tax=Leptolyngbya sp. NK1-12 TaxID=2547451 RepID=A0AA96WET1_9CYAN|nr:hypothetical protein [Leptolyngbya sp. NK1-12]MBF2048359.1 hypothetical protein [Elainella sp. C42_A2020_010]WNZ23755.1 hypothetical protein HJG54_13435 [Leptolyngbya sp. NK1-12]
MTFLTLASILLFFVLIVNKLLLEPLEFLASFHLPSWLMLTLGLSLLAWLIGE